MDKTAQVTNYINQQRSLGKTDLEIKQGLISVGWSEVEVDRLLQPQQTSLQTASPVADSGNYQLTNNQVSTSAEKKIFIFIAVIALILVLTGGAMLYLMNFSKSFDVNEKLTKILEKENSTKSENSSTSLKNRQYDPTTLSIFSKDELRKIGVIALPEGFQVQEEYKGIKVVSSPKKSYDKTQLGLLHYFIDRTPQKLLSPGPSAIVIYNKDEIQTGGLGPPLSTVAFASGRYIFFNEHSFTGGLFGGLTADNSIDTAFYAFEHELMHIAQFNINLGLIASKIDSTPLEQSMPWTQIVLSSELIENFAKVAGWEKDTSDAEKGYRLTNKESEKTTEYGKSAIYEDMAESIAGVILAWDHEFSDSRRDWALNFLKESPENLKKSKFPFSTNFQLVQTTFPRYDYSKKEEYKAKYPLVDEQVFYQENANTLESIKMYLAQELLLRGWQGSFSKEVKDDGVEIYKGNFVGNGRDMYIELRTYDNATGYSQKPSGTQIVAISGYSLK